MSTQEVPDPWATRMLELGITSKGGKPTYRELARRMEKSPETARRLVLGIGEEGPSSATIAAAVRVLGPEVQEWVGRRVDLGSYEPPEEASQLTQPQRDLVSTLIRMLVAPGTSSEPDAMITREDGTTHIVQVKQPKRDSGSDAAP